MGTIDGDLHAGQIDAALLQHCSRMIGVVEGGVGYGAGLAGLDLFAADLLDNRLHLVLDCIGELVALTVEELDAVIFGQIVARRDDDAAIGSHLTRDEGDGRRRHDAHDGGLTAFGAYAIDERLLEHGARLAAIPADEDALADLADRRASQSNRQVAIKLLTRDAANAIRAKQSSHAASRSRDTNSENTHPEIVSQTDGQGV